MLLLVALTGGTGFLASWVMLREGVASMLVRYPIALGIAYGVFLLLLWTWLRTRSDHDHAHADVPDFTVARWQATRSDAQIVRATLEGRGACMPPFRGTLTLEEASSARPAFYKVNADPQVAEGITATGNRHFYTDSSLGTIKATSENRPATAEDPSI